MLKKNPTSAKLGKKHENHIHIDWWGGHPTKWPPQAATIGFKAALIGKLQEPPEWLQDYMRNAP
jgi:hypothetical protein